MCGGVAGVNFMLFVVVAARLSGSLSVKVMALVLPLFAAAQNIKPCDISQWEGRLPVPIRNHFLTRNNNTWIIKRSLLL